MVLPQVWVEKNPQPLKPRRFLLGSYFHGLDLGQRPVPEGEKTSRLPDMDLFYRLLSIFPVPLSFFQA